MEDRSFIFVVHTENMICLKPEGLVSESQYEVDVHLNVDQTHLF